MRPRRIVRRIVARLRHWGVPHVHCPGCGADSSVPQDEVERPCFTCHTPWFRLRTSGDDVTDRMRILERVAGRRHVIIWHPLLVDARTKDGTQGQRVLDDVFVYLPETLDD